VFELFNYLIISVVATGITAIASEDVWVRSELLLDLLSDDVLVGVEADSAASWTTETTVTKWTWWAWWTLSTVDTINTSWTVWTLWTWLAVLTAGTGITGGTWSTSWTGVTWLTLWTWLAWHTVLAWVTSGTSWAWLALLTAWTSWTGWAHLTGLAVFTWVTVGTVWAGYTSWTGFTNWTASLTVWASWTGWTSWTLWTWSTSLTLSSIWGDIVGGETILTVSTIGTGTTGGTIHTTSAGDTVLTDATDLTAFTVLAWLTHDTHGTSLLLTFANATSGVAWNGLWLWAWALALSSLEDLLETWLVSVWNIVRADSVVGGDVLLEEVEVWAARQASLWLIALGGDSSGHDVDLVLSESGGSGLHLLEHNSVVGNTGVGHDHKVSSDIWVSATVLVEHGVGGIKTEVDEVTMALVFGVSGNHLHFLAVAAETVAENVHLGRVGDDTDSGVATVLSENSLDHVGGVGLHVWPVLLDASGTVHEDDDFDWAVDWVQFLSVVAALTSTVGQILAAMRASDSPELMRNISLAFSSGEGCGQQKCDSGK